MERTQSELQFEQNFLRFCIEIKRVILLWICPTKFPKIRIPIICRWRGVKKEVQRFDLEFGLEIFVLYPEINNLEIKFWVKNMFVASYSRHVIALKMCWKVTYGHRFDNNFWTVRNFKTWAECFRKNTIGASIWTKFFYIFDGNRESDCTLNLSHQVPQNTDSNCLPMEGRKNGTSTIWSWIWLGNIFPISRGQ